MYVTAYHVVLIFFSLMNNEVEYLFVFFLMHVHILYCEVSILVHVHFSIYVYAFAYWLKGIFLTV